MRVLILIWIVSGLLLGPQACTLAEEGGGSVSSLFGVSDEAVEKEKKKRKKKRKKRKIKQQPELAPFQRAETDYQPSTMGSSNKCFYSYHGWVINGIYKEGVRTGGSPAVQEIAVRIIVNGRKLVQLDVRHKAYRATKYNPESGTASGDNLVVDTDSGVWGGYETYTAHSNDVNFKGTIQIMKNGVDHGGVYYGQLVLNKAGDGFTGFDNHLIYYPASSSTTYHVYMYRNNWKDAAWWTSIGGAESSLCGSTAVTADTATHPPMPAACLEHQDMPCSDGYQIAFSPPRLQDMRRSGKVTLMTKLRCGRRLVYRGRTSCAAMTISRKYDEADWEGYRAYSSGCWAGKRLSKGEHYYWHCGFEAEPAGSLTNFRYRACTTIGSEQVCEETPPFDVVE